jgi:predicted GNAT superfamily acetyltransferase
LLIHEQEIFLPFEKFPWFRDAPIGKVLNVELPSAQHLYWPELDVDLEVESVLHPERYPLVSRVHEAGEGYVPAAQEGTWDQDKVDECVLALLQLTLHEGARAWKGFNFEVMDRLFEKGYILDPRGKAKSVVLTEKGLARSRELFEALFGRANKGRGN